MSTAAAVNTTATVNAPSANNVTTSSVSTVASQASSSAVATSTQPSQTSAAASTAQPQSAAYQSQTAQVSAVASTANVTTNYQGTSAATANGAVAASSSQQQTAAANSQTQSNQASGQAQTSTTSQAQSQAPATTNASQTQSTTNSNLQSGSVVSLATKIANSNSVPYVWGGSSLSGMDCSGLVDYVYKNAEGKQLPHNTVALESCVNQHSVSQAQAGDILFWGQHGATYHSAIYIGNNQYVAAAKPGTNVSTYTISSYFMPSFAGTVK
jgi:cell wall-associated NlpC family hydrolase